MVVSVRPGRVRKETAMAEEKVVALSVGRSLLELKTSAIHYAQMKRNFALIHMEWGGVYKARVTFEELKQLLGEEFVVLRRGLLVNAAQIHHLGMRRCCLAASGCAMSSGISRSCSAGSVPCGAARRSSCCCEEPGSIGSPPSPRWGRRSSGISRMAAICPFP